MPIVRKELFGPGTVIAEDPQGNPLPYHVTPAEVDRQLRETKEMLGEGLSIPIPLEHQNVRPSRLSPADRKANKVTNNAGYLHDMVKLNGKLFVDLDIPDAALAKKLPATMRFVSPEIDSFVDPVTGKKRTNVITHIALTNRPRWVDQEPFKSAGSDGAVTMSLASAPVEITAATTSVRLSMAAAATSAGENKWKLTDPAQLRLRLATEPTPPAAAETPPEVEEPKAPEQGGTDELLAKVREALTKCGIHLREEVPTEPLETFLEHLLTAIEAHNQGGDGGTPGTGDDIVEEPHSMLMSLSKLVKDENPGTRTLALAQQVQAKKAITARVARFKGLVPADVYKDLESQIPRAVLRLSLSSETGEIQPSDLERTLAILERTSVGAELTKRLSTDKEEEQPQDQSEEQRALDKKVGEEMVALATQGQTK
jgi:hypothetical protein